MSVFVLTVLGFLFTFTNAVRYGPMIPTWERLTKDGECPYHAALGVFLRGSSNDFKHFCSGAVIDSKWILTSASCIYSIPSDTEWVVLIRQSDLRSPRSENVLAYKSVYMYGTYEDLLTGFDLALIKLQDNITDTTVPIKLSSNGQKPDLAILSGWGNKNRYLQQVQVGRINYLKCASIQMARTSEKDSRNICYKSLSQETVCVGDTGSPLAVNVNGTYELIGIFSWTQLPCNDNGDYAVYADVTRYRDWIDETMKKEA